MNIEHEAADIHGVPDADGLRGDAEVARLRLKAAHAEIELLRGYRDEAESDAAIARLAVDRMRLTELEQASVTRAIETLEGVTYMEAFSVENDATAAATLRGLLERLA